MRKDEFAKVAGFLHKLGGWLMLPLFYLCAFGAFYAVAEDDYLSLALMLALMGWSLFEYRRFVRKQLNSASEQPPTET